MKLFKLEFSARDWKQGQFLLQKLGFLSDSDLTLSMEHELELDEDMEEMLREELSELDIEFELSELES